MPVVPVPEPVLGTDPPGITGASLLLLFLAQAIEQQASDMIAIARSGKDSLRMNSS
jgi:hypothetical protein